MSKQLVKKFKWWWVWQDGMHERWLQEQARQGLHLHASDHARRERDDQRDRLGAAAGVRVGARR